MNILGLYIRRIFNKFSNKSHKTQSFRTVFSWSHFIYFSWKNWENAKMLYLAWNIRYDFFNLFNLFELRSSMLFCTWESSFLMFYI